MWLATVSNLLFYDVKNNATTGYPLPEGIGLVLKILYGDESTLWISTSQSLVKFSTDTHQFEIIDKISNESGVLTTQIEDLEIDPSGNLWLATHAGLYLLKANTNSLISVAAKYPQEARGIISGISVISDKLWYMNHSSGTLHWLVFDNNEYTFQNVDQLIKDNNPHLADKALSKNSAILEDSNGRIWARSLVINPANWQANSQFIEEAIVWSNSEIMTRDGTIVFSGPNGVILSNTQRFKPWTYEPEVVTTAVRINNELAIVNSKSLVLPANTKSIKLYFAALEYLRPEDIEYAYMLEGFDEDWLFTKETDITYTNLPPGHYRLKLKSTNAEGVWTNTPTIIGIEQIPTWYQTSWFYAALAITLLFFAYCILQLRLASLKRQKVALQKLVDDRTSNLVTLGKMGQAITSSLDLEQVIAEIHKHISDLLDSTLFIVGIINHDKAVLEFLHCYENNARFESFEFGLDETDRLGPWCIEKDEEIVANSTSELSSKYDHFVALPETQPTESIVYLPLKVKGRIIGCISVQSPRKDAYSENAVDMLRTIATYAAVAIENASTYKRLIETQEKLIEAGKLASLSQLVTGIAHEINTPVGIALTTITSLGDYSRDIKDKLSQNLVKRSEIDKFLDYCTNADELLQTSLNRCSKLIQDFKSISSDQVGSELSTIQISSYLDRVLQTFSVSLQENQIDYHIEGENPDITTNVEMLRLIISNLVENTVLHAFPEESSKLDGRSISLKVDQRNNLISIVYSDNGVGMNEETKRQMFDPFFTTSRGNKNTGLGLNITYNLIVSGLNGDIKVDSAPNQGTTYTIDLKI